MIKNKIKKIIKDYNKDKNQSIEELVKDQFFNNKELNSYNLKNFQEIYLDLFSELEGNDLETLLKIKDTVNKQDYSDSVHLIDKWKAINPGKGPSGEEITEPSVIFKSDKTTPENGCPNGYEIVPIEDFKEYLDKSHEAKKAELEKQELDAEKRKDLEEEMKFDRKNAFEKFFLLLNEIKPSSPTIFQNKPQFKK